MAVTQQPIVLICPMHDGTDPDTPLDPTVVVPYGIFSTGRRAWDAMIDLIEGVHRKPNGKKSEPRFEVDFDRSEWHAYWKYTKKHCFGIMRRKHSCFYVASHKLRYNKPLHQPLGDLETIVPSALIRYERWSNPKALKCELGRERGERVRQ